MSELHELHNLLWVIPGVIFIHFYNKRRSHETINLSGWSYIFLLVIIAAITWLPFEILFSEKFFGKWKILVVSVISIFLSFCLAILIAYLENRSIILFNKVYDNFLINCSKWERKTVILSLKNDKIYVGILLKYPENPRSRYETQVISIIPLISGGRNQNTKAVIWGNYYPKNNINDYEVVIPRSEIITFGKFNTEVFKHFSDKIS